MLDLHTSRQEWNTLQLNARETDTKKKLTLQQAWRSNLISGNETDEEQLQLMIRVMLAEARIMLGHNTTGSLLQLIFPPEDM